MSYNNATPTVGWDPASFPRITASSSNVNLNGNCVTSSGSTLNVTGTSVASSGNILVSNGSGISNWASGVNTTIELSSDVGDFCELVLMALGYDITFKDFQKMSKEERKSILRDIKINRVLKGD